MLATTAIWSCRTRLPPSLASASFSASVMDRWPGTGTLLRAACGGVRHQNCSGPNIGCSASWGRSLRARALCARTPRGLLPLASDLLQHRPPRREANHAVRTSIQPTFVGLRSTLSSTIWRRAAPVLPDSGARRPGANCWPATPPQPRSPRPWDTPARPSSAANTGPSTDCHRSRTSSACAPVLLRPPRHIRRTDRGDRRTPRTPPRIRPRAARYVAGAVVAAESVPDRLLKAGVEDEAVGQGDEQRHEELLVRQR
jgi:hypothetical protein